jgi:hypothetical protein
VRRVGRQVIAEVIARRTNGTTPPGPDSLALASLVALDGLEVRWPLDSLLVTAPTMRAADGGAPRDARSKRRNATVRTLRPNA